MSYENKKINKVVHKILVPILNPVVSFVNSHPKLSDALAFSITTEKNRQKLITSFPEDSFREDAYRKLNQFKVRLQCLHIFFLIGSLTYSLSSVVSLTANGKLNLLFFALSVVVGVCYYSAINLAYIDAFRNDINDFRLSIEKHLEKLNRRKAQEGKEEIVKGIEVVFFAHDYLLVEHSRCLAGGIYHINFKAKNFNKKTAKEVLLNVYGIKKDYKIERLLQKNRSTNNFENLLNFTDSDRIDNISNYLFEHGFLKAKKLFDEYFYKKG